LARAHAVVVGSGLAGLTAALAVADAYEQVTVLDAEPREPVALGRPRPDAGHLELLQPPGIAALEVLAAGFAEGLRDAGVPVLRNLDELHLEMFGHVMCRSGALCGPLYRPTTATLADHVAARLPGNVEIRDRFRAVGLTGVGDRLTGVQTESWWGNESITADLVIDASGSAGACAQFLAAAGRLAPAIERVPVDLRFTSLTLDRPEEQSDSALLYFTDPHPGRLSGVGLGLVDGARWVLSVFGYRGAHPPIDRAGLLAVAADLLPGEAMKIVETASLGVDTVTTHVPEIVRRRWETAEGLPKGLVAIGDAWCSPNPAHNHGLMLATVQAAVLRSVVLDSDEEVAARYFTLGTSAVDHAWRSALGASWAYPEIGAAEAKAFDETTMHAVLAAAEEDNEVVNLLLAMNWGMTPSGGMAQVRLANAVAKSRRVGKRDARRDSRVERKGTRVERRAERKQRRAG
jgi:2-polyprenyl-6-methoxyphenol hydroxylase-like FAD-dependent oxidoreductase